MIIYIKALILSLIQSLTEFLPVSSSAHLIVVEKYLNFDIGDGGLFKVFIQLASILAVCIYFRKLIFNTTITLNKKESRQFVYKFILAFLPVAIFGLIIHKYIEVYMNSELVIAICLILGGFLLIYTEKISLKQKYNNVESIDNETALKIGAYQILSLVPGVSRSGSTIVGGILSGLTKTAAVEFSFLLAIPTILSATLFELYKNLDKINNANIGILIFSFISTFLMSTIVIKIFLNYISTHSFKTLGYYRILLGIIIILLNII